jgi:NTE family protein
MGTPNADALDTSRPGGCSGGDHPARSEDTKIKVNLVFQGGSVKGIALVGALCALADEIKRFNNTSCDWYTLQGGLLAGTSAGSIVAALIAAGYEPHEIRDIVFSPEIARLTDVSGWASSIPILGKPLSMAYGLVTELGAFKGDYFLNFMRELLAARKIRTFRDLIVDDSQDAKTTLKRYRAHFIAADITHGRMLVLPNDMSVEKYGVAPDDLDVALAVRMSVSVPFFFRPVQLQGKDGVTSYVVDGGLISNFPMQMLVDTAADSRSTTIGVQITNVGYSTIDRPFKALRALYALGVTAIQAHDISDTLKIVKEHRSMNTVYVDTSSVSILNFQLTQLQKEQLYDRGYAAMHDALTVFGRGRLEERLQRGAPGGLLPDSPPVS